MLDDIEDPKESICQRFRSLFKWFHLLNVITDEELKVICGTDGALYLVFLRYAAKFFAIITVMNFLVVLPIYAFGHSKAPEMFNK